MAVTLCLTALLSGLTPQGLGELIEREGVQAAVPELPAAPAAAPHLLREARTAGAAAGELCEKRLTLPGKRGLTDFFQMAVALRRGKPGPALEPIKLRDADEIADFFEHNHRAARKALNLAIQLDRTTPRFHALLQRTIEPGYLMGKEDRDLLAEEIDRAAKVDVEGLADAAAAILAAAEAMHEARQVLGKQPPRRPRDGVTGSVLLDRDTLYGRLVIGGPERNTYDCTQIDVIVDVGGDDVYRGPAGGAAEERRYAVCIDLDGGDTYEGTTGGLGSASYGIGVLVDFAGNDRYQDGHRSAGFGAVGVGIFADVAGDDRLTIGYHAGGVGVHGYGVFLDLDGDDVQVAGHGAFGCGLWGGVGLLVDAKGSDRRQMGADQDRGSLGMGAGDVLAKGLPGGVGVLLDLEGDDTYVGGDKVLGAADRESLGVLVDFAGSDRYFAAGLALGAARLGGIGVCIDVMGDDGFTAGEGLGAAAERSAAFFLDRGGKDTYEVSSGGMGFAAAGAMAFFQDLHVAPNSLRFGSGTKVFLVRGEETAQSLSVFRSVSPGDTYDPPERRPDAKGSRVERGARRELRLRR